MLSFVALTRHLGSDEGLIQSVNTFHGVRSSDIWSTTPDSLMVPILLSSGKFAQRFQGPEGANGAPGLQGIKGDRVSASE